MWSVQLTLISISFGSHMALERAAFSITLWCFFLLHSYYVLWCFQSVPVNLGFSTLFVQTSSVSGVKQQQFVAFLSTTVSSSFLFSSCGDTKAGFTHRMRLGIDLSSHSAPATPKS